MTEREYPEIFSDREDDLHNLEYLEKAQLILFMVIAKLINSPNPENAEKFLSFIISEDAQKIYKGYGFVPHLGNLS